MTNNEIIKFLQSKQIPQCGDKEYTADEEYEAYQRAIDAVEQQPSDTVSRGAFEQVMWERDVAIGQLKELGYGLGEKIEPCDNAISREAVYSILNEHHIDEDRIKSDMDERQNLTVNSIASDVSLLPSVTQKSAESEDKTE